jgi:uncharacterized protein YqhQ
MIVGGMAAANGVILVNDAAWAACCELPDGEVRVTSGPRPSMDSLTARVPHWMRPLVMLGAQLSITGIARRGSPGLRTSMEDPKTLGALVAVSMARRLVRGAAARSIPLAVSMELAGVVVAVWSVRRGNTANWHGAEHQTIAAHELGVPGWVADRVHPRCGTQLAFPLVAAWPLARLAATLAPPAVAPLARTATQVGTVLAAVQVMRMNLQAHERQRDAPEVGMLFERAGFWLQRQVTTKTPTPAQVAATARALDALRTYRRSTPDANQD